MDDSTLAKVLIPRYDTIQLNFDQTEDYATLFAAADVALELDTVIRSAPTGTRIPLDNDEFLNYDDDNNIDDDYDDGDKNPRASAAAYVGLEGEKARRSAPSGCRIS